MNYKNLKFLLLIGIVSLILGATCVSATEITNSSDIPSAEPIKVPGSFDELNKDISNLKTGDTYKITKDYVFNQTKEPSVNPAIKITADNVTIDGNYHSITLKGKTKEFRIFEVSGNNVTIKNFCFINDPSNNKKYNDHDNPDIARIIKNNKQSPITWTGNNGHLSDCTFDSTKAYIGGAINWSGSNGTLEYNKFSNVQALGVGGSIYLRSANTTLNNCYFVNSTSKLSNEEIYVDRNHKNILIKDCGFISPTNTHIINGNVTNIDINNILDAAFSKMGNKTIDLVPMIYKSITVGGINTLENNISYYATVNGNEFILCTSKNLKNDVTYMKNYHFKNITSCDDIYSKLFNDKYSNDYQLIANVYVNNTNDYETIANTNYGSRIKSNEDILKADIGSLNKIKYTTALNVEFLRQMKIKSTKTITKSNMNFDIINIRGHNSTIECSYDTSNTDIWTKIDQKIFLASNLNILGFNNAVENNGGNCIFNNITFKDNKMNYLIKRDWGAAILNTGCVACNNCSFIGNYAKNRGAIFSQGLLINNNCTFVHNVAYGQGDDICIGDGGKLIINGENITEMNRQSAVRFAESISNAGYEAIKWVSFGSSFIVGCIVGAVTVNPLIGTVAGMGTGALIGSIASSYVISKTYDANFNRARVCAILIGGSTAAGAIGGATGGIISHLLHCTRIDSNGLWYLH